MSEAKKKNEKNLMLKYGIGIVIRVNPVVWLKKTNKHRNSVRASNKNNEMRLVVMSTFSENVATAFLQRCFDVGPTSFQRFYNKPILIAINVLFGLTVTIRLKKEKNREVFLVVAKASFPITLNQNFNSSIRSGN